MALGAQLSILYSTPSPAQSVKLIKFDCGLSAYGVASVAIPSSFTQTVAVSHVRLSTGMLVVIYRQWVDGNTAPAFQHLYLATFTDAGGWANVDTVVVNALPGSDQVLLLSLFADGNDRVHVVYQDQNLGTSTFKTLYVNWTSAGGLANLPQLLGTDINSVNWSWTRGLYLKASDTICLFIRKADSKLYEYTGTPSVNPVFTQTVVATAAEQPDGAAPFPLAMLLNSTGSKRYAVWWASGTQNTITWDVNAGSGWSGVPTRILNLSATNWQITSADNGARLADDTPTITADFDIVGGYPSGPPNLAETAVYLGPAGANNLIDANTSEAAEMPVSLINVTGSPVFSFGGFLFAVLDYWSPTVGSERVSVWRSADNGVTWALQDDAHAPQRLPSSIVFIAAPAVAPQGGGMGCTPQCVDLCQPVQAEDLQTVNRGGDPAIVLAVLAAMVLLESGG